jgi:hypothetical protein
MPGIGGFFKGVKAAFAKTAQGAPKGTYVNNAGVTKAKPGYTALTNDAGKIISTSENAGILGTIQRNPGRTVAGFAAAGGAYYMLG